MKINIKDQIEKTFKKMIILKISTEVIIIIVGLVLLLFPNISNKIVSILLGVIILFFALNSAKDYFKRDGAKLYSLNLVTAIIMGLIGLFLIAFPFTIIKLITVCIALFLIVSSLLKINQALWIKKGGEESWLILFSLSTASLILGIILLFNPFSYIATTKVIGAFLIMSSVLRMSDTILFKKRKDKIIDIFW